MNDIEPYSQKFLAMLREISYDPNQKLKIRKMAFELLLNYYLNHEYEIKND